MSEVWSFGEVKDSQETYSDGTVVPHRYSDVLLDGVKIGYIEIHLHRRHGPDQLVDTSFGFTGVVYSKPVSGN